MAVAAMLTAYHRSVFECLVEDFETHDPDNATWYARGLPEFDLYVKWLDDDERGVDLAEGIVPCSHRWLIEDTGAIVGIVRIRHNIDTPYLSVEAGHIGYDVPPSQRGKGYGIASLQVGIQTAKVLGIEKVLVCADSDNEPSWRTIERCGGVLESELMSEVFGKPFRRYWIETGITQSV